MKICYQVCTYNKNDVCHRDGICVKDEIKESSRTVKKPAERPVTVVSRRNKKRGK